mmetsp:Transcript_16086/g.29155  ORF Transcript_16086/g.29155 Transcript_16086/m.29155 type:complete len:228 (-) Transcript_16086:84-767(-)
MPPANDDKDGPMDRLAKRLFAAPDSPFTAFADKQRIERLEQCRQLERILKSCQSANDAQVAGIEIETNPSEQTELEYPRSGARIARFFKWDSPDSDEQNNTQHADSSKGVFSEAAASFQSGDDGEKDQSHQIKKPKMRSRFSSDCARETHELWACRALALGCGNHVGDLRRCWNDANLPAKKSSTGNEITFENGNENSCRNIQVSMANCVNKHAAELAERVQAAKKQ